MMFGYKLVKHHNHRFKIADAEKSLIDYFYINPKLKDIDSFEELRIDKTSFYEQINIQQLNKYLNRIGSDILSRRISKFLRYMKNA